MYHKDFWVKLFQKSFTMFGFTYFSVAITLQSWTSVTPALMASGLYFFTELARHYKIQSYNQGQKMRKKAQREIHFLI